MRPGFYTEATLVVEGALQEVRTFPGDGGAALVEWVDEIEQDANECGLSSDVYLLTHYHAPRGDCECVQFLTDHAPALRFA